MSEYFLCRCYHEILDPDAAQHTNRAKNSHGTAKIKRAFEVCLFTSDHIECSPCPQW